MPEAKAASLAFDLPLSVEHEIATGSYNNILIRNAGTFINLQKFGSGYDQVVTSSAPGVATTLNRYPAGAANAATTFHAAAGQGVTVTSTPTTVGGLLKGDLSKLNLSATEKVAIFGGLGLALLVGVALYFTR